MVTPQYTPPPGEIISVTLMLLGVICCLLAGALKLVWWMDEADPQPPRRRIMCPKCGYERLPICGCYCDLK